MEAEKFLKEAGTQSLGAYIDKRQATVAEWVALRPILKICDKETCYKGGRRFWELWWRKTSARKHMGATLKDILLAARDRRWKSVRHGGGGGRHGSSGFGVRYREKWASVCWNRDR